MLPEFYLMRRSILLFLLVILPLGCARQESERRPNLILISLDTFRADHLGSYGHPQVRTPHLDRLCREGTQIAECYTSVPLTLPSHATLLTGASPRRHGVHENGAYILEEKWTTLAEYLRDSGYETGAIVSSFQLEKKYGLAQGFDSYDDRFPGETAVYDERVVRGPKGEHFRLNSAEKRAENVTAALADRLPRSDGEPFFLWLHYFDTHVIYDPPPPYSAMYAGEPYPENLYSGEVSYVDHHIGELIKLLEERGLYRSTLIVVIGDHGEGLGEHRETYHDQFIYDSTLRVPLIIGGGAVPASWNRLVPGPAAGENLLPTLLDLLKVEWKRDDVDGVSLLARREGDDGGDEPAQYLETYAPMQNLCSKLFGLRQGSWKYIEAATPELYNVDADPGERSNLARLDANAGRVAQMRSILMERLSDVEAPAAQIDAGTRERLEAIGYLQRTRRGGGGSGPEGRDPKEMADYVHGLHISMMHYTRGEYDSALALSLELSGKYPGEVRVYENIVTLFTVQNRIPELIDFLIPVMKKNPRYSRGFYHLGAACMREVRDDEAIHWLRKGVALEPGFQEGQYNLAAVLARNGWLDEALGRFEKVVALGGDSELVPAAREAIVQVRAIIEQSGGGR